MNAASQSNLGLRPYLPADAPLLAEIFRASVEELTGDDYDPGLLRIDFGERDPSLEEISWAEFFEKLDESDLAFLYQEETAATESRLNQPIEPETRH